MLTVFKTRCSTVFASFSTKFFDVGNLVARAVAREADDQEAHEEEDELIDDPPTDPALDIDHKLPPDAPDELDDITPPTPSSSAPTPPSPSPPPTKRRKPASFSDFDGQKTQKGAHCHRALKRKNEVEQNGQVPRASVSRQYITPAVPIPTALDAVNLPTAHGAYAGKVEDNKTEKHGLKKARSLTKLIALGFQLIRWGGRYISPAHRCPWPHICGVAHMRKHRRGPFATITVGLVYGKGCMAPTWVSNGQYDSLSQRLLDNSDIKQMANFASALGDFDPTTGGHFVLGDLKLVIEFPPGTLILIPSATLSHSNIPVRPGETRVSFTQFTSGGLFRYIDNGFRTEHELYEVDGGKGGAVGEGSQSVIPILFLPTTIVDFTCPGVHRHLTQNSSNNIAAKRFNATERKMKIDCGKPLASVCDAASDIITQRKYRGRAAVASEHYRDRKREEERLERRAGNAFKNAARKLEDRSLRKKHAPPIPNPAPKPMKPMIRLGKVPSKLRPSSPMMPTPVPRYPAILAAASMHSDGKLSDNSDEDDHEEHHRLAAAPIWPSRMPRPQRCPNCFQEDCVGCACFPDPGHEDRSAYHGPFYAIFCKEWRGCVTSGASRDRLLLQYPHATTFKAGTWYKFQRAWVHVCTEYHDHKDECTAPAPFIPLMPESSPESSPPSSPSSLSASTISTSLALKPKLSASPTKAAWPSTPPAKKCLASPTKGAAPAAQPSTLPTKKHPALPTKVTTPATRPSASPTKLPLLTREELAHLGNFRPGPGPLSPQRAAQLFARVLGPEALQHPIPVPVRPEASPTAAEVQPEPCDTSGGPVMYAVSGTNRVFQNRDRVMAALRGTPGADLIITNDEDEVFGFIAEEVGRKLKL
ncbi:hypothetical protein DFH07DRAFT_966016 [Mycena maculata]|uniref:Uncharacterized protein n=1 Tax=Mycena maculata TaxID=230809 RepID=A0AAD7MZB5_9AGAR|nr:hypothetical protein DFH07DRAFT_966016 [Mycena maculata]